MLIYKVSEELYKPYTVGGSVNILTILSSFEFSTEVKHKHSLWPRS